MDKAALEAFALLCRELLEPALAEGKIPSALLLGSIGPSEVRLIGSLPLPGPLEDARYAQAQAALAAGAADLAAAIVDKGQKGEFRFVEMGIFGPESVLLEMLEAREGRLIPMPQGPLIARRTVFPPPPPKH